jgi:tetratricopeptide (TPR) repeat protein
MTIQNMGNVYLYEKYYENAVIHYKKAIKLYEKSGLKHHDYANTQMNLGGAYYHLNRFDEASESFSKSL